MREEVLLRMGLDQKPLQRDLKSVQGQFQLLSNRILKDSKNFTSQLSGQIMSALRTNVYLAGLTLLQQLLPSAEEFWDSFYGVGKGDDVRLDKMRARFTSLRQELAKLQESVAKTEWDKFFGKETDEGKLVMISKRMSEIRKEQEKLQYLIDRFGSGAKPSDPVLREKWITMVAEARIKSLTLQEEMLKLTEKEEKVHENIAETKEKDREKQKRADKEHGQAIDRVRDAIIAQQQAARDLAQSTRDRSGNSLEDIANSQEGFMRHNPRRFRNEFVGPPGKQAAQEVMRLEEEARRASMFGNQAQADRLTNRALEMRKTIPGLSASERDPLGMMRAKVDESQLKVNEALTKAITPDGALVVTPKD